MYELGMRNWIITCCVVVDKIGKEYITLGVHNDIITILSTPEETANVITLSLQALSALITSGTVYDYVCTPKDCEIWTP